MASSYDVWLTDDAGRPLILASGINSFFSYSRTTRGYGVCQFGAPFQKWKKVVPDVFKPDWRLDFWRSPGTGFPKRREASFFLRKLDIYTREDGVEIIQVHGRSPIDILRRISVANFESTDYADDMMKALCQGSINGDPSLFSGDPFGGIQGQPSQILPPFSLPYTTGEYASDIDLSLGPTITQSYTGNVLDEIQSIKEITFQMNETDPDNRKIYFDIVEGPGLPGGFGYIFRTYADLRGIDRTQNIVFSVENGNLKEPKYYEDYLDQVTEAKVYNGADVASSQAEGIFLTRWNLARRWEVMTNATESEMLARTYRMLNENRSKKGINCIFLDTPGGIVQPRSLYGVDWDMGDLVTVKYAGKTFSAEVQIVYVAIDENGQETITGRNEVGAA